MMLTSEKWALAGFGLGSLALAIYVHKGLKNGGNGNGHVPGEISDQLASIMDYLVRVWYWDGEEWLMYDPKDIDEIREMVIGEEYSIQVTQACTIEYDDISIDLAAGWNYHVVWE